MKDSCEAAESSLGILVGFLWDSCQSFGIVLRAGGSGRDFLLVVHRISKNDPEMTPK